MRRNPMKFTFVSFVWGYLFQIVYWKHCWRIVQFALSQLNMFTMISSSSWTHFCLLVLQWAIAKLLSKSFSDVSGRMTPTCTQVTVSSLLLLSLLIHHRLRKGTKVDIEPWWTMKIVVQGPLNGLQIIPVHWGEKNINRGCGRNHLPKSFQWQANLF